MREFPKLSSRQIAELCGVSHHTVEAHREDVGKLPTSETRIDSLGRNQPATRDHWKPLPMLKPAKHSGQGVCSPRYPGTRGRGVLFRLEVGRGGGDCYTYDRRKCSNQSAAGGLLHLCYTYETPFEEKAKATESRKRNGLERKKAAFPRKNGLFCCLQSGTSRGIRTHDPLIKR